jgi:hypothetical protein
MPANEQLRSTFIVADMEAAVISTLACSDGR